MNGLEWTDVAKSPTIRRVGCLNLTIKGSQHKNNGAESNHSPDFCTDRDNGVKLRRQPRRVRQQYIEDQHSALLGKGRISEYARAFIISVPPLSAFLQLTFPRALVLITGMRS